MIEAGLVGLRFLQYCAASVLMGSALFFIYALPAHGEYSAARLGWAKPLLLVGAIGLAAGALAMLLVQTVLLAGSLDEALTRAALGAVTGMDLGKSALTRAALAGAAAIVLGLAKPGRALWLMVALLGAAATATFGWMGHGAASEGSARLAHLLADILHALAAAGWLGALAAFVMLVREPDQAPAKLAAAHLALRRFSPLGMLFVATLAITGLINSWFLTRFDLPLAIATPYGRLLALKLMAFAGMLVLAVLHRQRAAPALARRLAAATASPRDALAGLRQSLGMEAALGLLVMALVAWFGTLEPPALI